MRLFFSTSNHCNKLPYFHLPAAANPARIKPPQSPHMSFATTPVATFRRKEKIIVIMGATGTGKSKLSIELASCFPSEIINSDKMQVYKGLDITTNKIPFSERDGIHHHLLGSLDSLDSDLSQAEFRLLAHSAILDITSRRKIPIIVGGSNSLIHALVVERFDPDSDVFDGFDPVSTELRYNCCFLWVDVSFKVLRDHLSKRVDEMLDLGMFEELAEFYDPDEAESGFPTGLRKAIGVPEFDRYFKKYPPGTTGTGLEGGNPVRREAYEAAVREIKENTCRLAKRQVGKIVRLKGDGWDVRRLDATEALRTAMKTAENGKKKKRWLDVWWREVVEPSVKIVKRFLME